MVTGKIAYLIEEMGVSPYRILAITFTNKAAKEMKERVAKQLGRTIEGMWISTFHSMCVRILRGDIHYLGYDKNFAIYDSADQKTLIKECMKELNISKEMFKPYGLLSQISTWKNEGTDADSAMKENFGDFYGRQTAEVYRLYEKKKRENNALDFDDLLVKTVELFQLKADVLAYYQQKFEYIFVDEYQDTNHIQYLLVKMLSAKAKNLTVVGDNDQSIYRWRGADIGNILSFEKDFPGAKNHFTGAKLPFHHAHIGLRQRPHRQQSQIERKEFVDGEKRRRSRSLPGILPQLRRGIGRGAKDAALKLQGHGLWGHGDSVSHQRPVSGL